MFAFVIVDCVKKPWVHPISPALFFLKRRFRLAAMYADIHHLMGWTECFVPIAGQPLELGEKNGTFAGIATAIFDNSNAFIPTEHIWISEKLKWLKISDNLAQFAHGIPESGHE